MTFTRNRTSDPDNAVTVRSYSPDEPVSVQADYSDVIADYQREREIGSLMRERSSVCG